jgi:hypothetical protein
MLPIENSFIFPGLDKYSVFAVLEQADERSVVILSGVNREACQFLSNDGYFKQCVAFAFPKLIAIGFTFPLLCETHPINCWKFLSCASKESCLVLNNTFLKVRVPFVCSELESKKAHAKAQIQAICGSGYEDPDSSIHQLWLEYEKANSDMHKIMEDLQNDEHWSNASRTMVLAHGGVQLCVGTMEFLKSHSGLLAPGKEEELFAEAYSSQVPLRQDLLSCYRDWYSFYKKDREATDRRHKCYNDYLEVKDRRLEYCDIQQACNNEIAGLQDASGWMWNHRINEHRLDLGREFDQAKRVEKQLEAAASCIQLIDQIEQGQLKETSEACNQILDIICSVHSLELKWYVLEKLFQSREVDTERLIAAFPQCLPQLRSILSSIPKEVFFEKS